MQVLEKGIFKNTLNSGNVILEIFSDNENWQQILLETCKHGLEQLFREYHTNYFSKYLEED